MNFGKVIKSFTSKKGRQVVFRYPKEDDTKAMLEFINELISEDTFIEAHSQFKTEEEEQQYLDSLLADIDMGKKVHLAVEVGGKYVGNAELRKLPHRKAHVGELRISLRKEFREEGIGTELMQTLIELGKAMRLRLLTLYVFENNHRALHLYQKLGFRRAGMVPGAIYFKNEYIGEVKMYLPLIEDIRQWVET